MNPRIGILACTLLLAACGGASTAAPDASTSVSAAPTTTVSPTALLEALNDAAQDRFACVLGDTIVARHGQDSYYRSSTGAAVTTDETTGLEILTHDMVSYARFTGPLDADASPERRRVVAALAGRWGTLEAPDTITLEQLPTTPRACLDWIGVSAATISGIIATGSTTTFFVAASDDAGPALRATLTTAAGVPVELTITGPAGADTVVTLGSIPSGVLPAVDAAGAPTRPTDIAVITQDQYFALVGG